MLSNNFICDPIVSTFFVICNEALAACVDELFKSEPILLLCSELLFILVTISLRFCVKLLKLLANVSVSSFEFRIISFVKSPPPSEISFRLNATICRGLIIEFDIKIQLIHVLYKS